MITRLRRAAGIARATCEDRPRAAGRESAVCDLVTEAIEDDDRRNGERQRPEAACGDARQREPSTRLHWNEPDTTSLSSTPKTS
jgi:hypothetical protein